ncbi:hypothetical protein B0J13DRAFT_93502 [Dactylonectria estremocensis]|uniref:Uncharacterized protein n=1 Tax=Dactylonectria estremocensis TaxID=1079267 RepID=A0A9P9EAS1_9HYPO|nr:hypothetical protein B0J13DRAFT_93502 [Dactylonectria estremocensis]
MPMYRPQQAQISKSSPPYRRENNARRPIAPHKRIALAHRLMKGVYSRPRPIRNNPLSSTTALLSTPPPPLLQASFCVGKPSRAFPLIGATLGATLGGQTQETTRRRVLQYASGGTLLKRARSIQPRISPCRTSPAFALGDGLDGWPPRHQFPDNQQEINGRLRRIIPSV